jgi:hypothetical protein
MKKKVEKEGSKKKEMITVEGNHREARARYASS